MSEKTATVLSFPVLVSLCTLAFFVPPDARAQDDPVLSPEVVWTFETGGTIWGSSTTREGVVYFGSTDGNVYALAADTGELVWRFETEGPVYGSVTVYDGYLYAGSDDGYLYKIDRADGSEVWKTNIHEATPSPRHRPADTPPNNMQWDFRGSAPLEVEGMVYVGSPDHHLYALDAETGVKAWAFKTNNIVRSSPAVSGDVVVFGSFDQRVYALDKTIPRDTADDCWTREIALSMPVSDPVRWNAAASELTEAVTFLTGDRWRFAFQPLTGRVVFPNLGRRRRRRQPRTPAGRGSAR